MNKSFKLNNGNLIPALGLGTWKSEAQKVGEAVRYAILEAGYTHIDGAAIYRNEAEIGQVYGEIFRTVKREGIFITSKLWNTNHGADRVELACRKTLEDLQLDYLDLYLMHWGVAFEAGSDLEPNSDGQAKIAPVSIRETWEAMEKLVDIGLVKSIGVANFTTPMLLDLLTYARVRPAVNQIEVHPYNSQRELIDFCKSREILVTAYSPLARQGVDIEGMPKIFDEKVIKELSKKYDVTPAQLLLNWGVSRGTVVIPKSTTPSRIKENIDIFGFEIEKDDSEIIENLNQNLRFVDPSDKWGFPYFK